MYAQLQWTNGVFVNKRRSDVCIFDEQPGDTQQRDKLRINNRAVSVAQTVSFTWLIDCSVFWLLLLTFLWQNIENCLSRFGNSVQIRDICQWPKPRCFSGSFTLSEHATAAFQIRFIGFETYSNRASAFVFHQLGSSQRRRRPGIIRNRKKRRQKVWLNNFFFFGKV